jgi:hypothetical protein
MGANLGGTTRGVCLSSQCGREVFVFLCADSTAVPVAGAAKQFATFSRTGQRTLQSQHGSAVVQ